MEDFLRACHDVVKDAETKKLAALMNMPQVSLLQRVNPDNDGHWLNVKHLYALLLHSGDMRPLSALAEELGYALVPKEAPRATELQAAVLHMHDEIADVTKSVIEALADGHVSQIEKQQIKRAIGEASASLEVLRESVKAA